MKTRRCAVCGEILLPIKRVICGKTECKNKRNRFLRQKKQGNPNPTLEEEFDYVLTEVSRKEAIRLLKQGEDVIRDGKKFLTWKRKENEGND